MAIQALLIEEAKNKALDLAYVLVSNVDNNRPRNTEVLGYVKVEIELEDCWDEEISGFPPMLHRHQPTHESVSQTASLQNPDKASRSGFCTFEIIA
jgi:hypothetical protein